ncbi:MAG: HAD family phosphatase [Planctomycetota bacterium]|nr:MAG: HAD family phosphatase [Planctomycetota bacterium]
MFGLIFDMDGVLVDSTRAHFQSWCLLAEELGQQVTEEAFIQTFGRQNRDIVPLFFGYDDQETVQKLGDRKEELYRDIIRQHVPANDGAVELVRSCHQAGFKLAIGSSGPPQNIDLVLKGMRIGPYFDVRITSKQCTRGKPDPQVFSLAIEGLGIPAHHCAVVEDAPSGIQAALAAGAAAIALAGNHPPQALAAANLIVNSLRELSPDKLKRLIAQKSGD